MLMLGVPAGLALAQPPDPLLEGGGAVAQLPPGWGRLFVHADAGRASAVIGDLQSGIRADFRKLFDLGFASNAARGGASVRHGALLYTHSKAPGFSARADYTNLHVADEGAWLGELQLAGAFSEGPYFGALSLRNRFGRDRWAGDAGRSGATDLDRFADVSTYQMGIGYQDEQLAFGVAIAGGAAAGVEGSLAQMSFSINGAMSLGDSTVGIRFSGADLKRLGQDSERVSAVDGAGFALGLRHRFSDRTRAFAWYSTMHDVEFDWQPHRSPINDTLDLSNDALSIGVIHEF